MSRQSLGGLHVCCICTALLMVLGRWCPEAGGQEDVVGASSVQTGKSEAANVESYQQTGIPILPGANEQAYRREVTTLALMGVMGVVCTFLAFFAVWMLQRNSQSTLGANASMRERSGDDS